MFPRDHQRGVIALDTFGEPFRNGEPDVSHHFIFVLLIGALCHLVAMGADGINSGDEFALLADGPGKGIQATPAVAFGKRIYLVVWREGWHGKGGSARIYAARVSADGKLLDPAGIEVAPAGAGVQERPRVTFGGDTFLVVWQDLRNAKDYVKTQTVPKADNSHKKHKETRKAGVPTFGQYLPRFRGFLWPFWEWRFQFESVTSCPPA